MDFPLKLEKLEKFYDIRLVLLVFVLVTFMGSFDGALRWDEGSFLLNAEYFSGDDTNFEESRPAALSFLVSLVWTLTGESTIAGRMLIALFGAASVFVFYKLASDEFDDPLPVTAAFALSPLMLYWSFHVYTDVPALLFVLGSLYAYRKEKHLVSGILIALATTFRYVFAIFAVGMGITYLVENREKVMSFALGGIVGSLPFFGYSHFAYGSPVAKIFMYINRVSKWSGSGFFAATLPNARSAVYMLSALIPAAVFGWRKSPLIEKTMLTSYTLFILFITGNSFHRYWLPVLPFMLLIAYRGLDKNIFASVAVIMLVLSAHGVGIEHTTHQKCSQPLKESLDYVEQHEGKVVTDKWSVAGYYLDREVTSAWTDYKTLREDYNIKYAVVSEKKPYHLLESFENSCTTYYVFDLESSQLEGEE